MKKIDDFRHILNDTLDQEYMGKFPPSASKALAQMRKMIEDSDSPADVALALSLGMAFVLYASSNPEKTLSIMLAAAAKVADRIAEDGSDNLKAAPGNKFFKELEEKLQ